MTPTTSLPTRAGLAKSVSVFSGFEHSNTAARASPSTGELRAVRTAVRRLLRSGHFGVRQIIGIDSKVVEGIIAKGRSSSRELNLLMRSLAADMLVGDIQLGILGLASKHNPADEPSREKRVRKANPAAAPAWARNFVAGDVIALDTVLPADPRVQWCCTPQVRCARS